MVTASDLLLALYIAKDHRKTLPAQQQFALALLEWAMKESDAFNGKWLSDEAYAAIKKYYPSPKDGV